MEISFFNAEPVPEDTISIVVIVTRYQNQWVLVRNKSRTTWELPAGHREPPETLDEAACRELFEETGAVKFAMYPVGIYSVMDHEKLAHGKLYFADVETLGPLPESEIAEICFKKDFPEDNFLTYPLIQPVFVNKVREYLKLTDT